MILGSESERDKDERKSVVKRTHDDGLLWWLLVFISGSAVMANYFFFANHICVGVIITCFFLSRCVQE